MSALALSDPKWSYSVHSIHFDPLQPYSIHFGPIWSILSTLVLCNPFYPLQFYFVHIGLIRFTSIQSIQFGSAQFIWSYSFHIVPIWSSYVHLVHFVLFDPIWSIRITSVHFGPPWSIFVHLHNEKRHVWVESTLSKSKFIYIYIYISLKLVISKILSIAFIVAKLLLSHINVIF